MTDRLRPRSVCPTTRRGTRIERLGEALAVVKGAWGDGAVRLRRRALPDHRVRRAARSRSSNRGPPIVVGGGGRSVLRLAGREADIVGINPILGAGEIGADAARDTLGDSTRAQGRLDPGGRGRALRRPRAPDPLLRRRDHRRRRRRWPRPWRPAFGVDPSEALDVGRGARRLGRRGVRHPRRPARGVGRVVRRVRRRPATSSSPRSWPASPGPETGHRARYPRHPRGRGSVGRAQPCQGWGRGFESRRPLQESRRSGPIGAAVRAAVR